MRLIEAVPTTGDVPVVVPVRARRWLVPAAIGAGVLVCAIVAGSVLQLSASAAPAPVPSTTAPARTVVGIPGWSVSPAWEGTTVTAASPVARGDGLFFGVAQDGTVVVRDVDGAEVSTTALTSDVQLRPVTIDGEPALVALDGAELVVWSGEMTAATRVPVADGSAISILGTVLTVRGVDKQSSVLTGAGLVPYVSPRPGAGALAVTADGAMQWASARGEVLTASAAGTLISQIPLAPPVAGARIDGWLGGGTTILLLWVLSDGSTTLATHNPADGSVIGTAPVTATGNPLVRASRGPWAMLGPVRIDLNTGTVDVPEPDFQATIALGDGFYGAAGTATAVLTGDDLDVLEQVPTIRPHAVLADGSLLATVQGTPVIFPKRSAN